MKSQELCVSRSGSVRSGLIGLCLFALILIAGGCGAYHQPGETASERARRQDRLTRLNMNAMMQDIDKVFLLDEPSGLTENRVP